jgi:large subunit ribosomal protein L24
MHVKKGDKVIIKKGKDRGQTGTITHAFPKENKIIIDGLNLAKRRTRPRKQGEKGKVIDVAQSIDASNVALVGEKTVRAVTAPAKKKVMKAKKTA